LARLIDTEIKSPLSRKVLFGELKTGGTVTVSIKNNAIEFSFLEYVKPLTKEEKKLAKRLTQEEKIYETKEEN
jgi:hypothetical protein